MSNGSVKTNSTMFEINVEQNQPQLHVYTRFKQRLFEGLDYRKREAAISLHKLFRFVEKTVRVLGKYFKQLNVYICLI